MESIDTRWCHGSYIGPILLKQLHESQVAIERSEEVSRGTQSSPIILVDPLLKSVFMLLLDLTFKNLIALPPDEVHHGSTCAKLFRRCSKSESSISR